jgi:hypothetical protein
MPLRTVRRALRELLAAGVTGEPVRDQGAAPGPICENALVSRHQVMNNSR